MLIGGTQMHVVTMVFIVLEILMFVFQLARYFYRLEDRHRGWYCLLLFFLLLYNITGGFFPDPAIPFSVSLQNMIAYGTGFLMASFFPFYFYKEFELKTLRWHALFGVPLFLMLPYLVFFVIMYALNGDLDKNIRLGMVIPFIYSLVLLWAILCAIRRHYQQNRDNHYYIEELMVYGAISPWAALTIFAWFNIGQLTEVIFTNVGFLIITFIFFFKSARRARLEYIQQLNIGFEVPSPELFQANCIFYGLTRTEILIVQKIYQGAANKHIAENMYISEFTVKKHVQNVFRKTGVNNRMAMLHKLQNVQR